MVLDLSKRKILPAIRAEKPYILDDDLYGVPSHKRPVADVDETDDNRYLSNLFLLKSHKILC